jgi:glycosyltransferase involved in cell wall biosynthesis
LTDGHPTGTGGADGLGHARLLVLTSTWPRWPGDATTTFVRDLTVRLAALGWDPTVLAPHDPGASRREADGGVDVHRFRYLWPASAQTVCYGSGALANLRGRPLQLAKVPALVAAEQVVTMRAVRRLRPAVVHAHWLIPQGFVATMVPGRPSPPTVVTVHGGDVFALDVPGVRAAKRVALRRAAAVTVNSSATERAVLDLGADPDRLHRIPMGVDVDRPADPERVASIRADHRRDDGPLCVLVGRVLAEKGVFDLVDAVAAARAEGRTITAAVVGEGKDRAAAEQRAARLGVADLISFVGWVDGADVPSWLASADVVVAPSRTSTEGWVEAQGLAIVEAMAAERPIVATRTGGIADAITDGETGVLVDEGDPGALAAAVLALHDEPRRAGGLAAAARRRAVEHYAADVTAGRMSAVLSSVASDRSHR